jgi:hypothetical protein
MKSPLLCPPCAFLSCTANSAGVESRASFLGRVAQSPPAMTDGQQGRDHPSPAFLFYGDSKRARGGLGNPAFVFGGGSRRRLPGPPPGPRRRVPRLVASGVAILALAAPPTSRLILRLRRQHGQTARTGAEPPLQNNGAGQRSVASGTLSGRASARPPPRSRPRRRATGPSRGPRRRGRPPS